MSDTLEEKILGGPRIHYCDADDHDIREDEQQSADEASDEGANVEKHDVADLFRPISDEDEKLERLEKANWAPSSSNTGPKGVIGDYIKRRNKVKNKNINDEEKLELEFQELLNDESLIQEYISKRISSAQKSQIKLFGEVYRLQSGDQLLDAIDNECPNVTVIVHIYTRCSKSCTLLNRCLDKIASDYKEIKFVTLDASVTSLSNNFKENGVPALLAYRAGDLIKTLVQLDELLDQDFGPGEIKDLLIDNNLI